MDKSSQKSESDKFKEKSMSELGFKPREFSPEEASAKFPTFLMCIDKMLKRKENTDTKVIVGSETFNCHMVVLKNYSEYFAKLDKNENLDKETVTLPEDFVTSEAFHIIYEWMLSAENSLPRLKFAEVYKAARFMTIRELMSQCLCYIDDKKAIGEREALSIYLEATEVNEKSLQKFMLMKISKIFLTFVASWEYLMLRYEDVVEFFQSNRLGVNSELDMLYAAIRWLQHEWPQRKKSVANLMKLVRFELIQSWQLVELKKYPKELEHMFKIQEVQTMIDQAISTISLRYSSRTRGDGDGDKSPNVISRRIINDQMWNEFEFEKNPNVYINYRNFCKYLKQLGGGHWRQIKYADPKHESVIL